MKRSLLLSLAVVILLTSLACSALSGGSDDNGDPDVKATDPPVSSSGDIDVTIVNRSPDEICYVLMSPSAEDSWGDDWLGDNDTIMPGDTQVFSLDSGTYDVRVESCDEAAMATAWEVSRDTTVTAGASGADVRLMVSNESSVEVCYVYISPTTGDDWATIGWVRWRPSNPARCACSTLSRTPTIFRPRTATARSSPRNMRSI